MYSINKESMDCDSHDPTLVAAVATAYGEISSEMIKLRELLTSAYARKLAREGHRNDGLSIQFLTAEYRNKFRK